MKLFYMFVYFLSNRWSSYFDKIFLRIKPVITVKDCQIFNSLWQTAFIKNELAFDSTIDKHIARHHQYNDYSTNLLLMFLWWPIGTLRITGNDNWEKLPISDHFIITTELPKQCLLEVSLLTAKPIYLSHNIISAIHLIGGFYQYAKASNYRYVIAEISWPFFRRLKIWGINIKVLDHQVIGRHINTIPTIIDLKTIDEKLVNKNFQNFQYLKHSRRQH